MQRAALSFRIRANERAEYIERHRHVWPELIEAARAAGLRNHTVFLLGNQVFLYAEAEGLQQALARFAQTEVKQRWDREMKPLLDRRESTAEWQEVFHYD